MRPACRAVARLLTALFAALPLVPPASVAAPPALEGLVVSVVDGDTIRVRLATRVEKVRYIGIDTPEVRHPSKGEQPGGREASAVNGALVGGRIVRLETDVQTRDRYGRLLAYVWVGPTMINAELVRLGYAQVMTVPPNVRHQARFVTLQREARGQGRGLWRAPSVPSGVEPASVRRPPADVAPKP